MLGIFVVFFNLVIFVVAIGVIGKNIMNITNISNRFKNIYEETQNSENSYMIQNNKYEKEQENATFNSSIELENNPIKEKKGKRSRI